MTELQYYSAVSILVNQYMHGVGKRCAIGVGANEYLMSRLHASWRLNSATDAALEGCCPGSQKERALFLSGSGVVSACSSIHSLGLHRAEGGHSICLYGVVDVEMSASDLRDLGYEAAAVPELSLVIATCKGTRAGMKLGRRHSWPVKDLLQEFSIADWQGKPWQVASQQTDRPVLGWFHVACMNGGDLIAAELHGQLLSSGLYDRASAINVTLLGDQVMRDRLRDHIFSRHDKYRILLDDADLGRYEWPSMRHMWDLSRVSSLPEFDAFYIHTKAASNCRPDVPSRIQNNLRNWRHCMSHFVIGRWEENLQALREGGYWASGPLYQDCKYPSTGGIFAGNFWWAQSSHLASLCDPLDLSEEGRNRAAAEPWVCTRTGDRYYNQFWLETTDPYDFNSDFGESGPLARERWRNR